MSNEVMAEIWEHSPAKGSDLLLLLAVAYLADSDGYLTATASTLAEKSRMSVRNVYRTTKNLEEQGLLEVLERGAGRSPSRYMIFRSGANLSPQAAETGPRSGANPSPQTGDAASWCQSVTTTAGACGDDLAPQDVLSCQSVTTTDGPVEGTRASTRTKVGRKERTTPTYLPEPTDRARDEAGRQADGAAADNELTNFISTINFKRALGTDEFDRITALVATKRNDGWSYTQIRDAVDGRWDGVIDRVAVITTRLRRLAAAPPAPPKPKRPGRCELHMQSLPCIGCDADAKARNDED